MVRYRQRRGRSRPRGMPGPPGARTRKKTHDAYRRNSNDRDHAGDRGGLRQATRTATAAASGDRSRRRRRACAKRSADTGSRRARFGTAHGGRARARGGHPPETCLYRRQRRQGRPGAFRDRSCTAARRAECAARQSRVGAGDLYQQSCGRRTRALGFCKGSPFESGCRRRRSRGAHIRCCRKTSAGDGRFGTHHARVHQRDGADFGPRGPAAGHRRRAGRTIRRDVAHDDRADRSGLRELQQGRQRNRRAPPRRGWRQRAS